MSRTSTFQFRRFMLQVEVNKIFPQVRVLQCLPVLLVEVFRTSPRDRVQQQFLVQIASTLLFLVVKKCLVEVFKASPRDRAHSRFVEQITSTLQLVKVFTASPRDRAQQRFLEQVTSTFPFLMVLHRVL